MDVLNHPRLILFEFDGSPEIWEGLARHGRPSSTHTSDCRLRSGTLGHPSPDHRSRSSHLQLGLSLTGDALFDEGTGRPVRDHHSCSRLSSTGDRQWMPLLPFD